MSYNASGLAATVYSNVQGIYVHANVRLPSALCRAIVTKPSLQRADRNAEYLIFGVRACVDNATAGRAIFNRYTAVVGPLYAATLQNISRQLVSNETRPGGRRVNLW